MFSPHSLHEAHTNVETRRKPNNNPYDMDVVTGPSGPQSSQDPDRPKHEGGGWQDGTMS